MADHVVKVLNELIETSKNGEKGFAKAAEDTKNTELKALFESRSRDCASGAAELQAIVRQLGGDPATGGSVAGAMHRGWTELKSTVTGRSDTAILEECERGEDHAKEKYTDALKGDLTPEVRAVVERQYQGVLRNHDQIRELRNRFKAQQ
ncbi:PA2169 family four-helix-bundle protein [Achromobacter aloeverae]|uniref:Aldehyde dehydrogenase n=1 Tax=Achromobacter aloeverae TaxID=1750518 RepID=A0A4Q1HIQ7_9BURK|nr:PA2169 family four-helix-bundle protein [Achromobacter aloeverae]RXN86881.1 aldehyde dehydrogenase [Achromobacter aloeverae]